MARFRSQPTPNPDSLKITRRNGHFIDSGLLTFDSSDEAASHPLSKALFAIDGIVNVLILPEFLTVTKDSSHEWRPLWKHVEKSLEAFFDQ